MIIGTGIDMVDIERIDGMISRWGDKFLLKIFTETEQRYCNRHSFPAMHYAATFAAKEACLKALGTGMGMGIHWQDMELCHDNLGKPVVQLQGRGKEIADERGVSFLHVSLSHTDKLAVASVIAEAKP